MLNVKYKTDMGTFRLKLNRDVSGRELIEIAQLAANIVGIEEEKAPMYGPQEQDLVAHTIEQNNIGQTKLGENPVSEINMGSYKAPLSGVRIQMLHIPADRKLLVQAVKIFRLTTGISMMGCKHIICGNYPCPILSNEHARKIMDEFKTIGIYAKVVPAGFAASS